ncbi:nucleoside recognition domain-containing protein [Cytophagales bacterium LB-30]|uniref:Nucleoside recognition domain-containing protein n=1 Tax=Shiella aurantiaca TaxID=3058365 RepID=A0ABT8F1I3_9BACT|nr:nucleoside recognition domain-containing protein [Shiella aurantiaca]MDN4164308.1 nucleoside recognition domain-containing protein [Shiella aurantiaca]
MALNYIWIAFFIIAFVIGLIKWLFFGNWEIFTQLTQATFDMAKTGFEISLGLTGVLALWLGIMKIGEKGGAVYLLNRFTAPLFSKLFPEIPRNHPVFGPMMMNISANMLGLDNAATPLGLKAMEGLQELNPNKETASNAQIMFLVLNTSGLTIIPISIMVYRAQLGAVNPTDVFVPILLATFFSTMAGLLAVSFFQKINLFNKVVFAYLGGLSALVAGIIYYFSTLSSEAIHRISSASANFILFGIIIGFIGLGLRKKINVYESFIEGAKEGFDVAIRIIPYLIGILVAIGVFRASGALDLMMQGTRWTVQAVGLDTQFVEALPTAFMKPLSGSGARGMMIETMKTHGADSFAGRLASIMQGSTETTFYVLAVYFGAVNIKKTRHALTCGLIADLVGLIAAIVMAYLFFS